MKPFAAILILCGACIASPTPNGLKCTTLVSHLDQGYEISVCEVTLAGKTTYTFHEIADNELSVRQITKAEYKRWFARVAEGNKLAAALDSCKKAAQREHGSDDAAEEAACWDAYNKALSSTK